MAQSSARTNHRELAKSIVYLITHEVDTDKAMESLFNITLYRSNLISEMKLNMELGNSEMEQIIENETIDRHRIWLPKIVSKISEGSSFIAVGLGHLQYKTGVIQLLRQKGYTLEPVKLKKYGL